MTQPPPIPGYYRFQAICTVYGCPAHGAIDVAMEGESVEQLQATAIHGLYHVGWAVDWFGLLCPKHLPTHKIGKLRRP